MTYNVKINDSKTELAQSLLFYLKSLAKSPEYSFLEIQQINDDELSSEEKVELEFRLEHFKENKKDYNDWESIKHKYLKYEN
jgi:hypothetical protein